MRGLLKYLHYKVPFDINYRMTISRATLVRCNANKWLGVVHITIYRKTKVLLIKLCWYLHGILFEF